MFFDMNLLCHQRNGKFALIWLAATRGLVTLKKRDIENTDITHICNEILKYIMSRSTSPRSRLSLYLSANLMYGTVLVFCQQIKYFENEVMGAITYLRRPVYRCKPKDDNQPRPKRPRKKKEVPVEENVLQIIDQQTLPALADTIHITLKEDITSTRNDLNQPDPFGDEGLIDQQLALLESFPLARPEQPVPIPDPELPLTLEVNEPSAKRPLQVEDVMEIEEPPGKRPRVEPAAQDPRVAADRALIELPAVEIQQNLEQPLPAPPARVRPRMRHLSNINVIKTNTWKEYSVLRSPTANSIFASAVPLIPRLHLDPKDILTDLLAGFQYDEEDIISVVRDIRENFSIESGPSELRIATEHGRTLDPVCELEAPTTPNLQTRILPQPQISIQEPLVSSPRFSIIPLAEEIRQEFEAVGPVNEALEPSHFPRVHTSTPVPVETESRLQLSILEKIKRLFFENDNKPLKLEQICSKLTKIHVARTFSCLLYLQVQRYIKMKSRHNSIELAEIYPGERL